MAELREAVLVDFVRTPFGRASKKRPGFFTDVRSDDLGIAAIQALMKRTKIDPASVDDIIIGTPTQIAEQAQAARNITLSAGFPFEVPGLSVDRACGSSLAGAQIGVMAIQTGAADVIISGGIESLSHFPNPVITPETDILALAKDFAARGNPNPKMVARVDPDALMGMGITAENVADMLDISREDMDQWALRSNLKAAAAQQEGKFKYEIVPIEVKTPEGNVEVVDYDQDVRPDSNIEKIRTLPPVYKPDGKVNAASSSKESDGASMALLMLKEKALKLGLKPMVTIRSVAVAGCDPAIMGYSAYLASKKALERAGISPNDVDLWETNEAFAVVPIALIKEFKVDPEKMNVNGGACCIGHAVGASGIRMLGTLAHEMNRRGSRYGVASICGGMGQGTAIVVEREDYGDGRATFLEPLETEKV
ncbi:MAG: thiolase family protein [Dehalococcoidia bacterium]|nr:MAG: thiolase family protein [Dehalococcoidia bacterium]